MTDVGVLVLRAERHEILVHADPWTVRDLGLLLQSENQWFCCRLAPCHGSVTWGVFSQDVLTRLHSNFLAIRRPVPGL